MYPSLPLLVHTLFLFDWLACGKHIAMLCWSTCICVQNKPYRSVVDDSTFVSPFLQVFPTADSRLATLAELHNSVLIIVMLNFPLSQ